MCFHVLMGTRLGTKLNRLIKERAYLGGTISILNSELARIQLLAEAKVAELTVANSRLAEIDRLITEYSAIKPEDIRAIREKRRRVKGEHGKLILELTMLLKSKNGPVDTRDMVTHIVNKYSFPMTNAAERRSARAAVNGPLNKLKKLGIVQRLPSASGSSAGRWLWIGVNDNNQA